MPKDLRELPAALHLWPDEFLSGWEPSGSRLFLAALAEVALGERVAIRIIIRGSGIGATVAGPVVGVRHAPGVGLPAGAYLALRDGAASAAHYLERVARGLPVDFNERELRWAVRWPLKVAAVNGSFRATTQNVSAEGCSLTWYGPAVEVGRRVTIRMDGLFGHAMPAQVCWSTVAGGTSRAGLRLEAGRLAGARWRSELGREVRDGARPA